MPDSPSLPTLIALAFDRLTSDLLSHVHACGYADLNRHHFLNVLRFVSADGVRITTIARAAGVTQQAISLAVADLEQKGYVERVPDPSDRRAQLVRWSPRGRAAAERVEAWFADLQHQWADAVGADAVTGAIRTLTAALESSPPAGPTPTRTAPPDTDTGAGRPASGRTA